MPGYACTRMLISSADGYVFLKVLKGISTRRSSSPMPKPPFGFSTNPTTRKSVPSIITSLPTASLPGKSTGSDAVGKDVMIDGTDFRVVGVVEKPKGGFGMGDEDRRVLIPFNTFKKTYPS